MKEWTKKRYQDYLLTLKGYREEAYGDFNRKIVGKTKYNMIGVRTPVLSKIAKQIEKTDLDQFFLFVDDTYYEEVMIEGFLIASIKDKEKRLSYLRSFLPKIDNWAICDMVCSRMKIKENQRDDYLPFIQKCLGEKHEFTCRFGYVLLLNFYMEESYLQTVFSFITQYKKDSYYVKMAISWLLSYTYLVDKGKTLEFLKISDLDSFTCHKTISKIRESRRVSKEEKEGLRKWMY